MTAPAAIPDRPYKYPDCEEYLPWGPFYGVFVKEGTDDAIIDILAEAFTEAYEDESYQEVLESLYVNPLGYTGEEAEEYITTWTENTVKHRKPCTAAP